jgi:hypothetical protein
MAAAGHQFQASIGGEPARQEFIPQGQSIEINGRTFDGPLYACYDTTLGEISVVSLGADTSTSTTIAARSKPVMAEDKKPDFSEFCKAAGFDPATLNDAQKASMANMHAKMCAEGDPTPSDPDKKDEDKKKEADKAEAARRQASIQAAAASGDPIKARAAALRRAASIEAKCANHLDIAAQAMEEGWDDKRIDNEIELKVLRAGRQVAQHQDVPAMHIAGKHVDLGRAIEASCLITAGIRPNDAMAKEYGEANVEAGSRSFRGLGIRDIFRLCARAQGVELPMLTGTGEEFIRAALRTCFVNPWSDPRQAIRADGGATPVSLPGILSNVAHKLLLEGYNHVEQVWKRVSKQGTLQDFKPHNRFRLTNDMKFKPLNTSGELQHGKLGEQAYIIQGDTEGIMFNLDRKLIINDDMSAFSDIPKMVGRGAGLAINDAFWALFLSNPAITQQFSTPEGLVTGTNNFFSAANLNYQSGAGTTLSVAGLAAAYTLALHQKDPAGYPLGMEPTILLVPASLRYTAETLMLSRILVSQLAAAGTGTLQPSENPLAGKFEVAASAYLDNSLYTNASALAWYLLLDPNAGFHVIEAAFLNGMQTPTVERAEANFENLGVRFRSWIDFGLALGDPRGGTMSAGQ